MNGLTHTAAIDRFERAERLVQLGFQVTVLGAVAYGAWRFVLTADLSEATPRALGGLLDIARAAL